MQNWKHIQKQGLSLLRTIANVIDRLPVLQNEGNYGSLQSIPCIQQKLLQKQLLGLEQLLAGLQRTLVQFEAVSKALEKVSTNAQNLVQQDKWITPGAKATTAGPIPSINQCLHGLQRIEQMFSAELKLKHAIVSEVQYNTAEEDMQQILALYAAQPNVNGAEIEDLLHVMAATAEVPNLH